MNSSTSRTRSLVMIGLSIAIMAVSAWVTVPLGPIPFTLQMFALTFAIVVLAPKECMAAVAGYLLLGALGVPVFSGMRGGIGVLMGPTGGFLWGYLLGAAAGCALLWAYRKGVGQRGQTRARDAQDMLADHSLGKGQRAAAFFRAFGVEVLAGVIFTAIAYVCGCGQYTVVANATWGQAFLVCCAPFILVDFCKIVAAVVVAQAVKKAVGSSAR